MGDLSVSVVTYNDNLETLNKTIQSVLNTSLNIKLYVIDNSYDDCIRQLCNDKRIEYIFNGENIGFGAGHNIGIRMSLDNFKYHLVLNPDVFFEEGTLEKLFGFMEKNNDIGLVMPKVLCLDGSIQYLCKILPTPVDFVFRAIIPFFPFLQFILDKRNEKFELRFTGYNRIMGVPYLSGCFMFLKNKVLKKVGLMDERFFMHFEDCDLTRRINRYYKTVFYPDAIIYHGYARGFRKSFRQFKHLIFSAIRYFNKWGWFRDRYREEVNKETLEYLKSLN